MADGPTPLKVAYTISVGKEVSFSETIDFQVSATCMTTVVVPNDAKPVDVSVAAEVADALNFQFLLIRPLLLGQVPIKAADLVHTTDPAKPPVGILVYSVPVANPATADDQRKPLRGSHVFAAGQTEWVTDMLKAGGPGGLTKLRFWNSKPAAKLSDLSEADKAKVLKENPLFQDPVTGKPLADQKLIDKAEEKWAAGRHDITVQIVAGYSPILKADACGPGQSQA